MNWVDREKAKHQAAQQATQMYDQQYAGTCDVAYHTHLLWKYIYHYYLAFNRTTHGSIWSKPIQHEVSSLFICNTYIKTLTHNKSKLVNSNKVLNKCDNRCNKSVVSGWWIKHPVQLMARITQKYLIQTIDCSYDSLWMGRVHVWKIVKDWLLFTNHYDVSKSKNKNWK